MCSPLVAKSRRRSRSPKIGQCVRIPIRRFVGPVVAPRTGDEVAQFFAVDPGHLGIKLDDVTVGIAMIGEDVVANDMATRPPDHLIFVPTQEVACAKYLGAVRQLEGDMMHLHCIALCKVCSVMIRPAAHPDKYFLAPVRNTKTEDLGVEVDHLI